MSADDDDLARAVTAWRRHMPDITAEEVAVLMPLMQRYPGPLRRTVHAYRAGRAAAKKPRT